MIRVSIDLSGVSKKLDVRRQAGNLRVQPDLVGKLQSRVQDPALSQAELLKVLPASVPIRLAGETDTDQLAEEQDRVAQRANGRTRGRQGQGRGNEAIPIA